MKKIMILGASILQLPAILKAKEMGLQVISVDIDKNAIGFKEADICFKISTLDISKVLEIAKKYKIDGIMTLASDMPMRTVAAVAKELNIIGISEETALKATNKAIMRECLLNHNVPIPNYFKVNSYDEYIEAIYRFKDKCIIKPADNSGSRGVFLLDNIYNSQLAEDVFKYSKSYSRSGDLVVEEYMEGREVSVETLSIDGNVNVIAITDKLTTGAPRFVELGHSQPSSLNDNIKEKIIAITIAAVKALGIQAGPAHTEIILTDKGPKIVEIGARLGGDNITTHLVPISTGIDMVKACIEIALGYKPNLQKKHERGAAIRYFKTKPGKILSINGIDEANMVKGVEQISFLKNIGDIVGEINSSVDRIGFVIGQAVSAAGAVEICDKVQKIIHIKL